MTQQLKIGAYVILSLLGIFFGYQFIRNLRAADYSAKEPAIETNTVSENDTNRTLTATNAVEDTNAAAATNLVSTPATNVATNLALASKLKKADAPAKPALTRAEHTSRALSWGAGLFGVIVCLGLLIAHDFSHFAANRIQKFVFDENLVVEKDPEYEEAEKVWANGNHLEAIQLMRDYLKTHPREQYVAIRIAEIYEKDLGNYLAAALEYEEILKKKLPDQRWGWAAIHLANLYSGRLNRSQDAVTLLQRIVAEYGHTAAAKKARERLVAEGVPLPEPAPEQTQAASEPEPQEPAPPSNLPPGFKPKK